MDNPVNGVYGRYDKPPEHEKPFNMMTIIVVVIIFFVVWSVFLTLPTGFSFLAAKFAGGFFSYIGLFFLYMLGFFALLILVPAAAFALFQLYMKSRAKA
jgi:hypothetical protein